MGRPYGLIQFRVEIAYIVPKTLIENGDQASPDRHRRF